MALGADRTRVLALIVREGVRQVSIGAAAGAVVAIALAERIRPILFHVSPRDPAVIAAALTMLISCAAAAASIPGRRAMTIDPMTAIREE